MYSLLKVADVRVLEPVKVVSDIGPPVLEDIETSASVVLLIILEFVSEWLECNISELACSDSEEETIFEVCGPSTIIILDVVTIPFKVKTVTSVAVDTHSTSVVIVVVYKETSLVVVLLNELVLP